MMTDKGDQRKSCRSRNHNRRSFLGGLVKVVLGATLSVVRPAATLATQALSIIGKHLAALIKGPVIARGDANYEKWRQSMVWQIRKPSRYPELIVRPTSVQDIAEAINYARRSNLKVAVKSGGQHQWANFLRDEGMLLDMWNFRESKVDPASGMAQIGPSLWSYELMRKLEHHGLAFPVAHGATVPLGGFLLGGGLGFNWDTWGGPSCFSVLAADMVTAEGKLITVSEEWHKDLYWALRGGGNGFPGVVTRYHLKLYQRPAFIAASTYGFNVDRIAEVSNWVQELVASKLQKTELVLILADNPEASTELPVSETKLCIVRAVVYADSEIEARNILGQIAGYSIIRIAKQKNEFQQTNFEKMFIGSARSGQRFGFDRRAVDNIWTDTPKEALVSLIGPFLRAPSRRSHIEAIFKTRQQYLPDAAYSMDAESYIGFTAIWDGAEKDAANLTWLRNTATAIRPYARGHYINEVDVEGEPDKVRRSFSPEAWQRLRAVRRKYDPDGVFHDFFGLANG